MSVTIRCLCRETMQHKRAIRQYFNKQFDDSPQKLYHNDPELVCPECGNNDIMIVAVIINSKPPTTKTIP